MLNTDILCENLVEFCLWNIQCLECFYNMFNENKHKNVYNLLPRSFWANVQAFQKNAHNSATL